MKSIILSISTLMLITTNSAFGEMVHFDVTPFYGILRVAPQEEHPNYKDGILTLPRVDILEKLGMFQDARFVFEAGNWKLLDFKTANATPQLFQPPTGATLIITDSFPVQVFLKAAGDLVGRCRPDPNRIPQLRAFQKLTGNRFDVIIYQNGYQDSIYNSTVNCNLGEIGSSSYPDGRFEMVIPLHTYGLKAGIYQYVINRAGYYYPNAVYDPTNPDSVYLPANNPYIRDATGLFELKKDNWFPVADIPDPAESP